MTDDGKAAALANLETNLTEVEAMIHNAHRALAAGEPLDLQPLGERVAELCVGIKDMVLASADPEAVGRRLERMVGDLNRLEDVLRANAANSGLDVGEPPAGDDNDDGRDED